MDVDHRILTAFNVPIHGDPGLDPGWLDHRFGLFLRHCVPSVRAQTRRDFLRSVHFDERTPDPFRERVARHADDRKRFRPVFIRSLKETPLFLILIERNRDPRTIRGCGQHDLVIELPRRVRRGLRSRLRPRHPRPARSADDETG